MVPPTTFTSLRRGAVGFGRAFRPAIKPLAYGAVGVFAFRGVEGAIAAYGRVQNPPLQGVKIDTDGDGIPESFVLADTRTGERATYGAPPTHTSDDNRSDERVTKTAIVAVGGAIAAGLLLILATRK